jgi:hypothetical protein
LTLRKWSAPRTRTRGKRSPYQLPEAIPSPSSRWSEQASVLPLSRNLPANLLCLCMHTESQHVSSALGEMKKRTYRPLPWVGAVLSSGVPREWPPRFLRLELAAVPCSTSAIVIDLLAHGEIHSRIREYLQVLDKFFSSTKPPAFAAACLAHPPGGC